MKRKGTDEILRIDREVTFNSLLEFVQLFGTLPRRLNEPRLIYLLVFIRSGSGHCYIDNKYVPLQGGTFFLVDPFSFLQMTDANYLLGHVIAFTEDYFSRTYQEENLLYKCAYDPAYKVVFPINSNGEGFEFIKSGFAAFGLEYRTSIESEVKTRMLHTILYSCILYMHKLQLQEAGLVYDTADSLVKNRIVEYIQLLNMYFKEESSLAFYADKMFLSLKALTEICKRGSGWTPKAIMQSKLLIESKRLLIFDARPISDIASEFGFADTAAFLRFFSEQAGVSPKEFREGNKVSQ